MPRSVHESCLASWRAFLVCKQSIFVWHTKYLSLKYEDLRTEEQDQQSKCMQRRWSTAMGEMKSVLQLARTSLPKPCATRFTSRQSLRLTSPSSSKRPSQIMASDAVSDYVTLVASDGYSFVIRRSAACISEVIARMLNPSSKRASLRLWYYSKLTCPRWFHGIQNEHLPI